MSVLDVWNEALSAAHARGRLSSLTENRPEAEVCTQWYSPVLKQVQSAAWWPGCKVIARLALLDEAEDDWVDGLPEQGYAYSYAMPTNLLRPWFLTDYSPFSLSFSVTLNRQQLSTNVQDAALVYARLQEDDQVWTPSQRMATVHALAAYITGPLTGQKSLMQKNFELADEHLQAARAEVANTTEPEVRPAVPWLAARGYTSPPTLRYYYPFGALFAAGTVSAS